MPDFINRIIEILSQFVLDTVDAWGYTGVFALMALESANIPIPSEVIMPFAGFLAATGRLSFWIAVTVGAFGNLAGSWVSYWAAQRLDTRIRKSWEFASAERWFRRFGEASVFIGRLLPIIRTFISFPAGMFKVSMWKFSIYTFVGSFIWSAFLAYIGFYLGENWDVFGPYFRQFDYLILGALVVGFLWWFWHHRQKVSDIGNRV